MNHSRPPVPRVACPQGGISPPLFGTDLETRGAADHRLPATGGGALCSGGFPATRRGGGRGRGVSRPDLCPLGGAVWSGLLPSGDLVYWDRCQVSVQTTLLRGRSARSSASCRRQSSPRRGRAAGMARGGGGGGRVLGAWADSHSAASAACGPAQGPRGPRTCPAALWASRGKQHFHLSVSTCSFIYFCPRQQGTELGATTPGSLGHCPGAPRGRVKKWRDKGHLQSFPSLAPQGSRASDKAERVL